MTRFDRTCTGFLAGCLAGAVLGAIGGMLDPGSMMILLPSGNPFWALVGAFCGSIAGAVYGLITKPSARGVSASTSEEIVPKDETRAEK